MRSLMAAERADTGLSVESGIGFCGALLTGGRSSRLGSDKAEFDPFGQGPMLTIGFSALHGAGCTEIAYVGGPVRPCAPVGAVHLADIHPDEGPLGGIITALRWSPQDLIVVLACDMPFIDVSVVTGLATEAVADPGAAVVLAQVEGRAQPLTAVWRRSLALEELERGFTEGIRAPRLLLDRLVCRSVLALDPDRLVDIDSREDIERYAPISQRRRAGD